MGDSHHRDVHALLAKLFPQVRAVLLRDWDPIGISAMENAPEDEYDRYARTLCGDLIGRRATEQSIQTYLAEIAEDYMGLPADKDAIERTACAIMIIREKLFGAG